MVLGGAGFLGSHLCERLLVEGAEVTAVDNLSTGRKQNLEFLRGARLTTLYLDITRAFRLFDKVDYVFNMASAASPVDFSTHWKEILHAGSLGTENGLKLAEVNGAVFVQASTSEVYGDPLVHPQTESYRGNVNTLGVRSVYDEAKRYGEAIVSAYARYNKVSTRIARIFNTYGPRMRLDDGRIVPSFIRSALRGTPLTVHGDGSQTRSFCYVSDLVTGLLKLAESDYRLPVNLGNPHELSVLEFASIILGMTGSRTSVVHVPANDDDPKQRRPDISLAREVLGWEPTVNLKEGLGYTLNHFWSTIQSSVKLNPSV